MIAMPIKTENQNGILAPLFGKAKWFALIDDAGTVTIHANSKEGGMRVARWFEQMGVTTLITNHLGEKPFHALRQAGVKIYFAGEERISIEEAIKHLKANTLLEVTLSNYMNLLGEEATGHHHEEEPLNNDKKPLFKTKLKCCENKGENSLMGHEHQHTACHKHKTH